MKQDTICTLLFLTLGALPALAQTPDTTAAARYFPLDVGNVWEYSAPEPDDRPYVERREVVGDTVVDGQAWRVWQRDKYDPYTDELFWQIRQIVRFDTASARPFVGSSSFPFEACPLDAAFGAEIDCYDTGEPQFLVAGGYGASITISGQQVTTAASRSPSPPRTGLPSRLSRSRSIPTPRPATRRCA